MAGMETAYLLLAKATAEMVEFFWACMFLLILVGGSAAGMWLQTRLKEHHRSKDSIESVRMIVAMVVTFSALVLGLLVTSVKEDYDNHTELYRKYGILLIQFDQRLIEYGSQTEWIRHILRSYTAAVFVLTWPREPPPQGSYPTNLHPITSGSDEMAELTVMIMQMDQGIQNLRPDDPFHQRIAAILQDDIHQLENERWTAIERAHSRLSPIFIGILVFWLFIVFFIFGIVSPANSLTAATIALSALSVASALYLAIDLDTSLGGYITVSSRPFRDALWHMDQAITPAPASDVAVRR